MDRRKNWALLVTIALAAAFLSVAVACSSSNNKAKPTATESISGTPTEAGQAPSATSGETPQGTAAGSTLSLDVTEFKITGKDGGAITSPPAGQLTFEVKNTGSVIHEVVIFKTDIDAATLPMDGAKVNEDTAGEIIGEVDDIAAGTSETKTFDLQGGTYVLICNIAGHYQQGMYAQLVVQ